MYVVLWEFRWCGEAVAESYRVKQKNVDVRDYYLHVRS